MLRIEKNEITKFNPNLVTILSKLRPNLVIMKARLKSFLFDREAVFADIDSNGGAFLGFSREEEAAEDVYAFREHGG